MFAFDVTNVEDAVIANADPKTSVSWERIKIALAEQSRKAPNNVLCQKCGKPATVHECKVCFDEGHELCSDLDNF